MVSTLKQNGHPVTPKGIWFNDQEKLYPKEACDVHYQYSTIFPLSSNQNCKSIGYTRSHSSSHPPAARQAVPTHMPWMRQKGFRCSQLDPTQDSGSEPGYRQVVDHLPIPKSVLCSLSRHPYRGFAAFSPLSSGNNSIWLFMSISYAS